MKKNIQIVISDRMKAYGRFALVLGLLSLAALLGVILLTAYTVRLDIAFMEANAMLKHDMIREDIMREVFTFDNYFPLFIPLGLIANAAIAALFGLSQERYFLRFRQALEYFSIHFQTPRLHDLGPLQNSAEDFFKAITLLKNEGPTEQYKALRSEVLARWPKKAKTHLIDQIQFAAISGVLAAYYSALCMMIYWHANAKIVSLTSTMTHFKDINAVGFFDFQFGVSEFIGWTFIGLITAASCYAGVRFSKSTAFASYAIRRQLKLFLDERFDTRINLRKGDPGITEVSLMNVALEKIENHLKEKAKDVSAVKSLGVG